jgi:magnesium transporter
VRELESDDVVDILEDLEEPAQGASWMRWRPDRAAVEQSLAYPEYSAGRLMQREVVTAPVHWTVGEAIDFCVTPRTQLPDQFYHVVLVDPRMKPVGYVTLGRILSARREVRLASMTEDSFRTLAAPMPEGRWPMDLQPVSPDFGPCGDDAGGRLVGVITIDDAMAVLDEEHEEDMLRMAGVGDEPACRTGCGHRCASGCRGWR